MSTKTVRKPVYQQIKEKLKEDILTGKVRKLSESFVIQKFMVSSATSRRVLNEIEEEGLLERKVGKGSIVIPLSEKKIKELIAVFFDIFDPREPFIADIIKGIEEQSRGKNYHLHLYTTRNKPLSVNTNVALYYLVTKRKIDGLFILSPLSASDISFFQKEKIPFVVISNNYPELATSAVLLDHKSAIREICVRLLKMGYKRIGLIAGPMGEKGIQRGGYFDLLAYREFVIENRLSYREYLFREKPHSEEAGYEAMKEFYSFPGDRRPDAVIVSNAQAATGVLKFIRKNKDWQPFIIPYTNRKEDNYPCYVMIPYKELGEAAFTLLEHRIQNYSSEPEQVFIPLKVVFSEK